MTAHDGVIANAGFPAVRSDLNAAMAAAFSQNASTALSSGAVAGMWQMRQDLPSTADWAYNAYDGTDSIRAMIIDVTNNSARAYTHRAVARSTDFTIGSTTFGILNVCSPSTGGMTATLMAASSAGNGFRLSFRNDADDIVTIDGNGAETIDGLTTLNLARGMSATLICDGSNWKTEGMGPRRFLQRVTASSAATVDLTLNTSIDDVVVEVSNAWPTTAGSGIFLRYSVAAAFLATGYSQQRMTVSSTGGVTGAGSTNGTAITVAGGVAGSTHVPFGASGTVTVFNVNSTQYKHCNFEMAAASTVGLIHNAVQGSGVQSTSIGGVDGLRFLASAGNINGTFDLWGIMK